MRDKPGVGQIWEVWCCDYHKNVLIYVTRLNVSKAYYCHAGIFLDTSKRGHTFRHYILLEDYFQVSDFIRRIPEAE